MTIQSVLHPDYCTSVLGLTLDELLMPIAPQRPAGESLRGTAVYRTLQEARREEDPTLPQGPWERELKRADWEKVAAVAGDAVAHRSKDLQVAAWLAEAQIHRAGFLGLAAALTLMHGLCQRYWDNAFPALDAGDLEHRINIFLWVNEKLLPALRMVPLTAAGRAGGEYGWADWEQARRNEQLLSAQGPEVEQELEGATAQQFSAALTGTPVACHVTNLQSIDEARRAVERLESLLDEVCGQESPSFKALHDLLCDMALLITSELRRRGALEQAVEVRPFDEAPEEELSGLQDEDREMPPDASLQSREEAYAVLEQVARYLAQVEPHSPVPYLIMRAVEWGQLNTAELYELVFVRHKGQLSIFDLLGIEPPQQGG